MMLTLGIIIGLLIAILVVATMIYFRKVVEQKVGVIQKQIELKGPRPQGYVFEPDDEDEEARKEIIKRNDARGRDTKMEELR